MIESFRHAGLRSLFQTGDPAGVRADLVDRLRMILAALDTAVTIEDLDRPTFNLHHLGTGEHLSWSIDAGSGWFVLFRFRRGTAQDVSLSLLCR